MENQAPVYRTGKICYVEIPADDITRSADFYRQAFGWTVREDDAGFAAFDDTVGGVSGMWVLGRPPSSEPGLLISVMVASAEAAVASIIVAGGEIVRPLDAGAPEKVAWFRDPAGNVLGIYEQPGLAATEQSAIST